MLRLVDHLKAMGLAPKQALRALEQGKIFFDGIPTGDAARDVEGHHVAYRPEAPKICIGRDPSFVFYDEHLAVVHKPSGVLSVDAPKRHQDLNMMRWVSRYLGAAHPVHRLDEETSGLMLVARTPKAQYLLKEALARHQIQRNYWAFVTNHFPNVAKTFDTYFVRNRGDKKRGSTSDPTQTDARRAITHVRRVATLSAHTSWVEAQLQTGRTHQVRIHLAEAGFPILGDPLYATPFVARASRRLALHAYQLALIHPIFGEYMTFEAPLPDDMERLRRRLCRV